MNTSDQTERDPPLSATAPQATESPLLTRQLVHDLRNALQPVLMAAHLLQRCVHDVQTRQLCETIHDGSRRALALLQAVDASAASCDRGRQTRTAASDVAQAAPASSCADALCGGGEPILVLGADSDDATHLADILDLYGYAPQRVDTVSALASMAASISTLRAVIVDGERWPAADAVLREAGFSGATVLIENTDHSRTDSASHVIRPVTAPVLLRVLRAALAC